MTITTMLILGGMLNAAHAEKINNVNYQ